MKIVHTVHGLAFHPYGSRLPQSAVRRPRTRRGKTHRRDHLRRRRDDRTGPGAPAWASRASTRPSTAAWRSSRSSAARPRRTKVRNSLRLPKNAILVTQISRLAELKGHEFIIKVARRDFRRAGALLLRRRRAPSRADRGDARLARPGRAVPPDGPGRAGDDPRAAARQRHPGALLAPRGPRPRPAAGDAGRAAGRQLRRRRRREVVDAETGILLEPKDTAGLTLALETLADCEPLRKKMGKAGRARCREMFDHNRMVDQIEALYRRLLEG